MKDFGFQAPDRPDDITPEMETEVKDIIARNKERPGALIPVLQECQEKVGYLPVYIQYLVARGLGIPASTVYGVVTFYSYFTMVPRGRHTIKICLGTACYVRGAGKSLERIQSELNVEVGGVTEDRRFSLEAVRCLGACGLAPVMVVDNDTHGGISPDKVMDILSKYE